MVIAWIILYDRDYQFEFENIMLLNSINIS